MKAAHAQKRFAPPRAAARALLLVAALAAFRPDSCAQVAPPARGARRAAAAPAAQATPAAARRPATLEEYRVRVREAAGALEELVTLYGRVKESEKPEVWSREDFNSDFVLELPKMEASVPPRVRALLPPREKVERGEGSFVEVDNSWLHSMLGDLKRNGDRDKQSLVLGGAARRLRALDAHLAEAEVAQATADKDAERGRLNAILRDPAFNRETRQKGGALRRLWEAIQEWLGDSASPITPGASPRASGLAQVLVFGLCLAVLAYVGRRLWLRRGGEARGLKLRRKARVILGERLEADESAADLLDAAERLARGGDLRGAIRKAYVALLCELGERGVIRLAQHNTNRDYLNAVRRAAPPRLYTEMLPLTFDFELHWYGLQPASDSDWDNFRTRCRKVLKESSR